MWIKVISHGEVPTTWYAHASTVIDTKIVIFGGLNSNLYARGFVSLCELNKMTVKNMIFEDEVRMWDDWKKGWKSNKKIKIDNEIGLKLLDPKSPLKGKGKLNNP